MPNPNPAMSDLDSSDIESLARILTQPVDSFHGSGAGPSESEFYQRLLQSRKRVVKDLIHELPPHLRRPMFHNLRLFGGRGRTGDSSPFCEIHSELNADIIRMIFCFLEVEVGMRLNTLASNLSLLSLEQMKLVRDLRSLHSLWYPPELYGQTFFDSPQSKWTFQADRCKACMLARVGADKVTLTQLRITLLARRQRKRREPRLLRWVDGCIGWKSHAQEVINESKEKAKSLKRARRRARRASGKRGRKTANKNADKSESKAESHPEAEEQVQERYFEESILDCYTSSYDGSASDVDDSSQFSQQYHRPRRSAESQAEEYRTLLDRSSPSEERPGSQVSRQTRWSDFVFIKQCKTN